MIAFNEKKCTRCGQCAAVCPGHIIEERGGKMGVAYVKSCIKCYHCVAVCPEGAASCDEFPLSAFKGVGSGKGPSGTEVERMLMGRRSVREFRKKEVSRELLEKLVDVATHAPTGHNAQAVHLNVITDRELIDRVDLRILKSFEALISLFSNPVGEAAMRALGGKQMAEMLMDHRNDLRRLLRSEGDVRKHVFRGAPVLVVGHTGTEAMSGKDDCVIALSHLMFAAEAHGLGGTWIGYLVGAAKMDPTLKRPLGMPMNHALHAAVILGWPKYKYKRTIPRKPLSVKWM